jgi:pimeloyl-ACP methyl ester carboxylesterase
MAQRLPIVFSHANGFPAGTYRLMFEAWRQAGHEVHAIDRLGHDPLHPVTSNWPHLRDELIRFIERQVRGPAFLVGHSLGGVLSLLVASHRPELAAGVVLLDSPIVAGWRALALRSVKTVGLVRQVSPAKVAQSRRERWPDAQAVRQHFARKAAFARWDARVLEDYVQAGFEPRNGEWALRFERAIEADIYDTLPHHVGPLLVRQPPQCPVAFIGGRDSVELKQAGMSATRRVVGQRLVWTEGSHLFPMEHPETTARLILDQLNSMPVRSSAV